MKLIHEFVSCLLYLLVLAELIVHSSCRPVHGSSHCGLFGSMLHQVEQLMDLAKTMHDLTDDELVHLAHLDHRLDSLPHIEYTAAHFSTMKLNKSLAQMYEYTQSFKLHVSWMKTAQENFSLPLQAVESSSRHLHHLSNLIKTSLQQITEEVPQSSPPSFPVISTAFDALRHSLEISERLEAFCIWSKRVLRHFQRHSRCPRN
ncbi:uncharacterized protein ACNS7B_013328 [Menidia menidia]